MAFKNEYIPPLEQETSEFLKKARETLRTGHYQNDAWTVDRESNRVLKRTGKGHEIDDRDEEYWEFIDGSNRYSFTTKNVNYSRVSEGPPERTKMTRDILHFWSGDLYSGFPDERTIQFIKEAFRVYGAYCIASKDEECQHTLLLNGEAV